MKPVSFIRPMALAAREGRKTQTRRTAKDVKHPDWGNLYSPSVLALEPQHVLDRTCPYGKPGDRLWVREEYYQWGHWEPVPGVLTKKTRRQKWKFFPDSEQIYFEEPRFCYSFRKIGSEHIPNYYKRLARFMPRKYSRTILEVVSVRVEGLQGITGEDVLSEGVTKELIEDLLSAGTRCKTVPEHWIHGADEGLSYCHECALKEVAKLLESNPTGEYSVDGGWGGEGDSTPFCEGCGARLENSLTDYGAEEEFNHFLESGCFLKSPDDCYSLTEAMANQYWDLDVHPHESERVRQDRLDRSRKMLTVAFRTLWESINGPGSWDANPYVWVGEFKVVEGGAV